MRRVGEALTARLGLHGGDLGRIVGKYPWVLSQASVAAARSGGAGRGGGGGARMQPQFRQLETYPAPHAIPRHPLQSHASAPPRWLPAVPHPPRPARPFPPLSLQPLKQRTLPLLDYLDSLGATQDQQRRLFKKTPMMMGYPIAAWQVRWPGCGGWGPGGCAGWWWVGTRASERCCCWWFLVGEPAGTPPACRRNAPRCRRSPATPLFAATRPPCRSLPPPATLLAAAARPPRTSLPCSPVPSAAPTAVFAG